QRDALADVPQALGLREALGHHRVADHTALERDLQQSFELRPSMLFGFAVAVFQQHAIRWCFFTWRRAVSRMDEGHAQLREMPIDQTQSELSHDFKSGQTSAQVLVR